MNALTRTARRRPARAGRSGATAGRRRTSSPALPDVTETRPSMCRTARGRCRDRAPYRRHRGSAADRRGRTFRRSAAPRRADPEALVADRDPRPLSRSRSNMDATAVRRVLDRVVDQVEGTWRSLSSSPDTGGSGRVRSTRARSVRFRSKLPRSPQRPSSRPRRCRLLLLEPQPAGIDLARQEDVADDPRRPRLLRDDLEERARSSSPSWRSRRSVRAQP